MIDELRIPIETALRLPSEDRALLAGLLLDSIDQETDEDMEAAWRAELAKRVAEIDSGKVQTVPWSKVRRGPN